MAKRMVINCANCDARKVKEETLAAYESVMINAAMVFVSPETKELMNRYGVTMNCANVLELDPDVQVSSINGSAQIEKTDSVTGKRYLTVNGSLTIGTDTGEVLEQYVGITVNGTLTCPESVSAFLGKIKVNGSTNCYPDGAVLLKRSAVIDRLFALRAKERLYWSSRRMIMVDPQLDAGILEKKGVSFSAKEFIMAESKVESLIRLVDEKAEIIIVPDGTAVILDDVDLDEMTLKKYGTKLYVIGDVKAVQDGDHLAGIEYLNICGDLTVTAQTKEKLLSVLTQISGSVKEPVHPRGRHIEDKMSFRITKWLLEQETEGLSVSDCMTVKIDPDVPKELIMERLSISDCMKVDCSQEQEDAVTAICEDVMTIGNNEDASGMGDIVKGALGGFKDLLNTKMINAADYVM